MTSLNSLLTFSFPFLAFLPPAGDGVHPPFPAELINSPVFQSALSNAAAAAAAGGAQGGGAGADGAQLLFPAAAAAAAAVAAGQVPVPALVDNPPELPPTLPPGHQVRKTRPISR